MSVSPSTIAFAIATCIPFGLAIRDTVQHRNGLTDTNDEVAAVDAETEARLARMRAEQAAEDAEREAEHRHRQMMLVDLIGRERATLGSSLEGISISMTAAEFEAQRHVLDAVRSVTDAAIRGDAEDTALHALVITPPQDSCEFFGDRIDKLWGVGQRAGASTYWHSADNVRASFTSGPTGQCTLQVEQAVAVERWVDKRPGAVVPFGLIGKSTKALLADITTRSTADRIEQDESSVHWFDAGVGNGAGRSELTAVLAHGKVAWLEARADMDIATTTAVQDLLTTMYGEPRGEEVLTWSARPKITLALGRGTEVVLVAGTLPPTDPVK